MAAPSQIPTRIAIDDIGIDPAIYPRADVDRRLAERYAAVLRDGVTLPPIRVEAWLDGAKPYRILDGAHTHLALQLTGAAGEIDVLLVELNGQDPLLFSASCAIGPTQLKETDARECARRAYQRDPKLSTAAIARAVGRAVSTVNEYIRDLRAVVEMATDLKIMRMHRLGIPQDRIGARLDIPRETVRDHLARLPELAESPNADLERGFPAAQVAEKYDWPEPLVWSVALEGRDDLARFSALQWNLRTWDLWNFKACDARFGDDWPGRIPAHLVAHTLYYFTRQGDLVFDPMAGGGVVPDVCLALRRQCWSFDSADRPDMRPEIEPHYWVPGALRWPVNGKAKPDLVFFDPPYFAKMQDEYAKIADEISTPISSLSRSEYLDFFRDFFSLCRAHTKRTTRLAFLNADWRSFQGVAALDEDPAAITLKDYWDLLEATSWQVTHRIECPMPTERLNGSMVRYMQTRRTIGVVGRTLLVARCC